MVLANISIKILKFFLKFVRNNLHYVRLKLIIKMSREQRKNRRTEQ